MSISPAPDRRAAASAPLRSAHPGWMVAAGAASLLAVAGLAVWLRFRRTQPDIDAETAQRLRRRATPGEHPRPSAAAIVIGES